MNIRDIIEIDNKTLNEEWGQRLGDFQLPSLQEINTALVQAGKRPLQPKEWEIISLQWTKRSRPSGVSSKLPIRHPTPVYAP